MPNKPEICFVLYKTNVDPLTRHDSKRTRIHLAKHFGYTCECQNRLSANFNGRIGIEITKSQEAM
jgi:hypothetical protein